MTASDYHLAKRRRLEDSSSFTHTRSPTRNSPQYGSLPNFEVRDGNPQSFPGSTGSNISTTNETLASMESCTSQQDSQETVMVDNTCAISTSITLDDGAETVCFGTLTSITALTMTENNDRQSYPVRMPLRLGSNGTLQSLQSDSTYGALEARDTQLLALFSREGIEFELLWMPKQPQKGTKGERKAMVWATIYGPRNLIPDLRELLQDLELYLQDPIHALRDVVYFNPQRFINERDIRTSHFQATSSNRGQISTVKDEDLVVTDVLESLTTESTLPETPGSPCLLTELMSHQKQGLTFMIRRESGWRLHDNGQDVWSQANDNLGRIAYINNIESSLHYTKPASFRGGIIADPMGLGKTLSMISLIAHDKVLRKESESVKSSGRTLGRGTLLVLPSSLLHNWEEELSKHLSTEHFAWQRHHGRQRIQETSDVSLHDIVLTTYTTLAKEWRNQEQSPVFSHDWHRVVLDEAHEIKDLSTSKAQAACALRASCRWVVTGTPIQNRLSELFSLFCFLRLNPYCEKRSFNEVVTDPWLCGEERGLQALVKLLGYTMLRRSKNAITLPRRRDHRRFLRFTAEEQNVYDIAKQKAIKCVEDALASCKSQESYSNALQKINALRVICELGCSPRPGLHITLPNFAAYSSLLAPRTMNGSPIPSTMMDDTEDDDCRLETDKRPCGDISSRLQECFPPYTTSGIGVSLCPEGPSTESPVASGQWPTKIQALIEDLQNCAVGAKSVVFSYRKSILDIAKTALRSSGIGCVQIDGKLDAKKRSDLISMFSKNETVQVLLLSLGCGAVGAYLLEPQWNPSIEEQALARIHRLGQTQEVTTIRFVISGSIEQYVLDIQDGKRDLISLLTSEPANGGQLTAKLQVDIALFSELLSLTNSVATTTAPALKSTSTTVLYHPSDIESILILMNAIQSDEMVNSQRIQQLANTIPGYVDIGQGGRGRLEQCRVDTVKVRVVLKC